MGDPGLWRGRIGVVGIMHIECRENWTTFPDIIEEYGVPIFVLNGSEPNNIKRKPEFSDCIQLCILCHPCPCKNIFSGKIIGYNCKIISPPGRRESELADPKRIMSGSGQDLFLFNFLAGLLPEKAEMLSMVSNQGIPEGCMALW